MSAELGLVILAQEPIAGQVKPRLAETVGAREAADFYRCFLFDTLASAYRQHKSNNYLAWAAPPGLSVSWVEQICPGVASLLQTGPDLGARIAAAAVEVRQRGCEQVLVISSDSPSLPFSRLRLAQKLLARADIVLGPTRDGGCYLIGGNIFDADLFKGVAWGTKAVSRQIQDNAFNQGLRAALLPTWYDLDTVDDLRFLQAHLASLKKRGLPCPCDSTADALTAIEVDLTPSRIGVIIPALNAESALGKVLAAIPSKLAPEIVVVDNGSTDRTPEIARAFGARVIFQPERGYGAACQAGIAALDRPDIIVFLGGNNSDYPEEMEEIVAPLQKGFADLVIGSRMAGNRELRILPPGAVLGNWLASLMLWYLHHQLASDLGPFRAIRADALMELGMIDRSYGWAMEMQAKAVRGDLRVREVPASYRRPSGETKIIDTLRKSLKAGSGIIKTAFTTLGWQPDSFV
jgi:rSAM/selenodomain-associated transferase 1